MQTLVARIADSTSSISRDSDSVLLIHKQHISAAGEHYEIRRYQVLLAAFRQVHTIEPKLIDKVKQLRGGTTYRLTRKVYIT